MPVYPGVLYQPSRAAAQPFSLGNPIGLVLHRTEGHWAHVLQSFSKGPKSAHFLVGKQDGQVVQLVDTAFKAQHAGPGANDLYLGIEFESIPARTGYPGQDPRVIRDELTPFQASIGAELVAWIARTHKIPLIGPPDIRQWLKCKGRWNGVLGHANLATGGFFHTTHGDTLQFIDFIVLNVWPAP